MRTIPAPEVKRLIKQWRQAAQLNYSRHDASPTERVIFARAVAFDNCADELQRLLDARDAAPSAKQCHQCGTDFTDQPFIGTSKEALIERRFYFCSSHCRVQWASTPHNGEPTGRDAAPSAQDAAPVGDLRAWQPIATAPHEAGRFVIMVDAAGQVAEALSKSAGYWRWVSTQEPVRQPTHWMPLPSPPQAALDATGRKDEVLECKHGTPKQETCQWCEEIVATGRDPQGETP